MLELQQIVRQSNGRPMQQQSRGRPSPAVHNGTDQAEAGRDASGWTPDDELAALETVWESLCLDAASSQAPLQPPERSNTRPARIELRQLRRGSARSDGQGERLAS